MHSFDDLFGPDYLFSPGAMFGARRWLPDVPESMTGGQLTLFRNTPCICHAGAATRTGLRLLADVGHHLPNQLHPYRNDEDLVQQLLELTHQGLMLVISHLPLHPSIAKDTLWMSPELLSRLNHKGFLSDWVPPQHLPRRHTISTASLAQFATPLPVVLKAATDVTTGGGKDVMRYTSEQACEEALRHFTGTESLVVEEWVDFQELWCVNYAIHRDGQLDCLGAAGQLINASLGFAGNRFLNDLVPGADLMTMTTDVARRIAQTGYHGVLGLDAGRATDGRLLLFDINARMNASTSLLIARDRFPWIRRLPVQRSIRIQSDHSLDDCIRIAESAVADERFLPVATFDPSVSGLPGPCFVSGLINGDDDDDIDAYLSMQLSDTRCYPPTPSLR